MWQWLPMTRTAQCASRSVQKSCFTHSSTWQRTAIETMRRNVPAGVCNDQGGMFQSGCGRYRSPSSPQLRHRGNQPRQPAWYLCPPWRSPRAGQAGNGSVRTRDRAYWRHASAQWRPAHLRLACKDEIDACLVVLVASKVETQSGVFRTSSFRWCPSTTCASAICLASREPYPTIPVRPPTRESLP